MLSSSQFKSGQAIQHYDTTATPVGLSAGNLSTASSAAAYSTKDMARGKVMPYSKKTSASLYKWDDEDAQTALPKSDKGAGRNDE